MRRFAGLRLLGALPDETTILKLRHLLEKHGLGEALIEEINAHLASLGHRLKTGTIVDASILTAPSSTKNRTGERDPEMHQTRKGKQWYFGMKAHIGVYAQSGLAHSVETTPANTSRTWRRRTRCCTGARSGCGETRATRGWASARRAEARRWTGRWR